MTADNKPTPETLNNWHNNPANWKWGMFYYNKEDKRIFPPKRIPYMGWTVNFANPLSLLALVVLVAAIVIVSAYIKSI